MFENFIAYQPNDNENANPNELHDDFLGTINPREEYFPVKSTANLKELDQKIGVNFELFISLLEVILFKGGLKRNLCKIFDPNLLRKYNYRGVKGKRGLQDFKNVDRAVFEALMRTDSTGTYNEDTYIKEFKNVLRSHKNKTPSTKPGLSGSDDSD